MLDTFEIQKLRGLPIEGVAERVGLRVRYHKALCPFHDDHHASLSFSVRRNTYRCFVCGASGGPIDLVMRLLHKDFPDACRWLRPPSAPEGATIDGRANNGASGAAAGAGTSAAAEGAGFSWALRFFEHPWLSDAARRFLFEERRLDERVVRWCRLTSYRDRRGTDWLTIPYYDQEGRLIGMQNRNLVKGSLPRFRFPQGAKCSIYNLPVLKMLRPGEPLYITEGCSDCWAMLSAGHKAIAIPSATLLSREDKEMLQGMRYHRILPDDNGDGEHAPHSLQAKPANWSARPVGAYPLPFTGGEPGGKAVFHMFPDRDEPGERLFLQLKEVLPSLVHHQLPPDCKDFSDYYLKKRR